MRLNVEQIMDLHEVDSGRTQKRHGTFHGFDSVLLSASPHFGGEKKFFANTERRRELANHLLGASIHRGRINHAAAEFNEKREHILERLPRPGCQIDVEFLPRPEPDHWQFLARGRNCTHQYC